ncbi:DUF547 domain-containing protein [Aquimarina sp. MMG016]|uniref:DUF547 domain-containing protein n=1 Tax=Aquimarina sp. MMG016 TaxID=2822690 RepID=UPI001B39F238|nr:DUF547 domain-containing protein [Aquimarina sp. MMG016]MBQ4820855.1 DUF547 domain-containing protein [Aquimarina sp. MMG016]
MKKITLLLLMILSAQVTFSQDVEAFFTKADAFFKVNVSNGRVNYKAIKKDPSSLNLLIEMAAEINVSKSNPKTYQAFYINAYNLAVIKGIVDKYPTKSPLDIKGFFDKTTYNLGGKTTTLNDLENKILRKNFPGEARFHFVLVCAGLGCPPIITEAYKPSVLEKQLQRQTVKALNDPNFIKVKGKKVQISQIFEWYKEDFVQNGSEIDYINTFRKEPLPAKSKVSYYPYNWSLNQTK